MMRHRFFAVILLTGLLGCNSKTDMTDAYGNFETIEVIVSSESQGRILMFESMEGDALTAGEVIVLIDTLALHLQKKQLETARSSLHAKLNTLEAQVHVNRVQLENLEREKERIDRLAEGGAATPRQQDEMADRIELLKAQTEAVRTQERSVDAEEKTLEVQIAQVEDRIGRCAVKNPESGILLTKYNEEGEMAVPGQPLYKMANMERLILRAYVTGNQLSGIRTGQEVKIRYDVPGGLEEVSGKITWISPRAEFTPKTIQTREERVNLVYAIKVLVPNNGSLKIGMPGEVVF
ncbi:MAG TPA: HlyD family efflux transporter periplasmic adaptor subunit [Bacteroides sp.]|nr:HlyD family efflux transporter periplasmic adaptor subunit [Bacteroides sp.]